MPYGVIVTLTIPHTIARDVLDGREFVGCIARDHAVWEGVDPVRVLLDLPSLQ